MRLIDLTHPIDSTTAVYPGDPPLVLVQNRWLARDHYNAYTVSSGMHVGTHVDLPLHMQDVYKRQDLEDQLPAQALVSLEELERALYQLRGREKQLGVSCLFQVDDALALQAETLTTQDLMRLHSIGACFATLPLASSMGIRQEPYWNEALGQVSLPWRDDAWLPYLTLMNRWHRDGILQYRCV